MFLINLSRQGWVILVLVALHHVDESLSNLLLLGIVVVDRSVFLLLLRAEVIGQNLLRGAIASSIKTFSIASFRLIEDFRFESLDSDILALGCLGREIEIVLGVGYCGLLTENVVGLTLWKSPFLLH